jgi:hypothetical protein
MKTLTSFFRAVGITALIYVTIIVSPALIGCIIFGDWNIYLNCIHSAEYMAILSFLAILVILIFWSVEADD